MTKDKAIDINYVANLARIELSDDEKQTFSKQLENILEYFEKINAVDVSNVEPMAHPFASHNIWDEDEPKETFTPEQALKNAPLTRENQIEVPKVVE